MTFTLGARSRGNLRLVAAPLVGVVELALSRAAVDFGVPEQAWRTLAEQQQKVADGVSKTLHSNHLLRDDGRGYAVDLVPFIGGRFTWDGDPDARDYPFYFIAAAMRSAAIERGVSLTWGAVWDRRLEALPADPSGLLAERIAYNARHPGRDFNDYPHFQLEG